MDKVVVCWMDVLALSATFYQKFACRRIVNKGGKWIAFCKGGTFQVLFGIINSYVGWTFYTWVLKIGLFWDTQRSVIILTNWTYELISALCVLYFLFLR